MSEYVAESGYDTAGFAYDPSGARFTRIWVGNSGQHSMMVSVSGGTFPITSGTGVVISGQTIVLTSGAGVVVSGQVLRISEESGRAAAQLKGYDLSGTAWRDLTVDYSGSNRLRVSTAEELPATYTINTIQDMRSGAYLFAMYNSGDSTYMTIEGLYTSWVNPFIVSGAINPPLLELWRITALSGGGSGQVHLRADTDDPQSGMNVMLHQNCLSGAGSGGKMYQWNLPWTVSGNIAAVSSLSPFGIASWLVVSNYQAAAINWIPNVRGMKEPMVRSGQGLAIRQSVNAGYTQWISGQIFITAVYTVRASGVG